MMFVQGSRAATSRFSLVAALLFAAPITASAQRITSPREQFGFDIGDDYKLADYRQLVEYWQKLDQQSDRMTLERIGTTAEGRPMWMAIITSPENHKQLARYKSIAQQLAHAEGIGADSARALARIGKAVVWIDGGLHATEVLGAQQLIQLVYDMVSKNDDETRRFLDDDILLATLVNPDGMDLVSDWYMSDPKGHPTGSIPRLYEKYAGHDNNRDFYMVNLPETQAITRVQYRDWFPVIVYNHHQTGPAGTVMFAPPFRDPFNYNYDPLVVSGIDLVGAAMQSRFLAESKGGVTVRSGSSYSTWWNGGLRTTPYFHNMIGLLTETIGNPTPVEIPFVPRNQLPRADIPLPIAPQIWHFKQSVDYSETANRAVLDVASRYRETLLYNLWRMGQNSIDRGNRDSWTVTSWDIEAVDTAVARDRSAQAAEGRRRSNAVEVFNSAPVRFYAMLRDPAQRDPRAYVIPSDQPDFLTATKFVNALIKNGIFVERTTAPVSVGTKRYAVGSYVVRTAQAFRPHILDMFEPQAHPNDFAYPGGPPRPPYDLTGWTLAYQMGVRFDRLLDPFAGPTTRIADTIAAMPARVTGGKAGWLLSHQTNDAFVAINRLLAAGDEVYWLGGAGRAGATPYNSGAFFIASRSGTASRVQQIANTVGVSFDGVAARPAGAQRMKRPRIALFDRYGGSSPSGWTRFLFDQYGFPYTLVYPRELDAGNLAAKYDVIVLPSDMVPQRDTPEGRSEFEGAPDSSALSPELRAQLGRFTIARSLPRIREFLEAGGTVVAVGTSTVLGGLLQLPITNVMTESDSLGRPRAVAREKFYAPGSILAMRVDTTATSTTGMPSQVDVLFDNDPVFRINAGATDVKPVAWYTEHPLRSGWLWGESYVSNNVAALEARVGKGRLYLFGPEITFRAQPHGTFKMLFNALTAP